jgi:hypothetical protein
MTRLRRRVITFATAEKMALPTTARWSPAELAAPRLGLAAPLNVNLSTLFKFGCLWLGPLRQLRNARFHCIAESLFRPKRTRAVLVVGVHQGGCSRLSGAGCLASDGCVHSDCSRKYRLNSGGQERVRAAPLPQQAARRLSRQTLTQRNSA